MIRRFVFLQLLKFPFIRNWYVKRRITAKRQAYSGQCTEEIFSKIYEEQIWAPAEAKNTAFHSGSGSYGLPANEYVQWMIKFINRNGIKSMVDLGCGDFGIGRQITGALPHLHYTGCDVVPALINQLHKTEAGDNIKFMVADAAEAELPAGSLLTIRQVLQHLDNDSIQKILAKIDEYTYVVITEHQLAAPLIQIPNKDKPVGPDTRLREASSVCLEKRPFSLQVEEVLRVRQDAYNQEAYIVSYLVKKL